MCRRESGLLCLPYSETPSAQFLLSIWEVAPSTEVLFLQTSLNLFGSSHDSRSCMTKHMLKVCNELLYLAIKPSSTSVLQIIIVPFYHQGRKLVNVVIVLELLLKVVSKREVKGTFHCLVAGKQRKTTPKAFSKVSENLSC